MSAVETSTFLHHAISIIDWDADRVCGSLLAQHVELFGTRNLTYLFRDMRAIARRVASEVVLCHTDGQPRRLDLAVSPVSMYAVDEFMDFDREWRHLWRVEFEAVTCTDRVDGCMRHIEITLVRHVA